MDIEIRDGRGENMKNLRDKNREKIIDWFVKNPGSTQKECADGLGLSLVTVWAHLKRIREDVIE